MHDDEFNSNTTKTLTEISDMASNPNSYEKIRVLGNLAATILIPLVIALVANWYTSAIKDRELSAKYITLAIGILREEPKKGSEEIRKWAIDTVNMYSKVKISKTLKEKLLIEPINITVDVNVKVDKELDGVFNDVDPADNKHENTKHK